MNRILNDTCYYLKEFIAQKQYHLNRTTMWVVGNEIRYEIALAQAKLEHYTKMYKEYKEYGYIDDKEAMEIELDEKLEEIEKAHRGTDEEEYVSILEGLEEEE